MTYLLQLILKLLGALRELLRLLHRVHDVAHVAERTKRVLPPPRLVALAATHEHLNAAGRWHGCRPPG